MRFEHPRVVRYIMAGNSFVATMRNYPYRVGQRVRIRVGGRRLRGDVLNVVEATDENARKYVGISGFDDPGEWLREAIRLHGGRPKYIVVVRIWGWGHG